MTELFAPLEGYPRTPTKVLVFQPPFPVYGRVVGAGPLMWMSATPYQGRDPLLPPARPETARERWYRRYSFYRRSQSQMFWALQAGGHFYASGGMLTLAERFPEQSEAHLGRYVFYNDPLVVAKEVRFERLAQRR